MYKVMIVEDDPKIAALLQAHIQKYGNEAEIVQDFEHVLDRFKESNPHVVLLDINLPRFDGYYWCRQIRAISTCPILFISARSGKMDQVMALENGADDFITKPFHYEIVIAKIQSHIRRAYGDYASRTDERVVEKSGLTLYPEKLELQLGEITVSLTKKEAVLMGILLASSPNVASREKILEKLWDDYSYVDENTLSVNINRVRKKLSELGVADALETVRGLGYRLNPNWKEEER
ncbi:response regulator transcription factor [Paenibacillus pasadenensis]|uniref:response regulator transcription factor n=1 Tax=Paenibacillus pasadenensis TaxID=217090 RepID=UPI00203ADD03|nr:response regulator transcription factor [Paenibacillus pasadenensis]MCM3749227.1 response regulator transcription factor [Paenibacillus pasadenensis]